MIFGVKINEFLVTIEIDQEAIDGILAGMSTTEVFNQPFVFSHPCAPKLPFGTLKIENLDYEEQTS